MLATNYEIISNVASRECLILSSLWSVATKQVKSEENYIRNLPSQMTIHFWGGRVLGFHIHKNDLLKEMFHIFPHFAYIFRSWHWITVIHTTHLRVSWLFVIHFLVLLPYCSKNTLQSIQCPSHLPESHPRSTRFRLRSYFRSPLAQRKKQDLKSFLTITCPTTRSAHVCGQSSRGGGNQATARGRGSSTTNNNNGDPDWQWWWKSQGFLRPPTTTADARISHLQTALLPASQPKNVEQVQIRAKKCWKNRWGLAILPKLGKVGLQNLVSLKSVNKSIEMDNYCMQAILLKAPPYYLSEHISN